MTALYLSLAFLLLLLNAFFVLAEFAAVRLRRTRVEALARSGDRRAAAMLRVQAHLDEYLSVCQVGITFASIGLGFVGEPAVARLIEPALRWIGEGYRVVTHGIAIGLAYAVVSYLHIVIGELVPKSLAIRGAEGAALWTARPLAFFRYLFYPPLVVLNGSANLLLRAMGYPPLRQEEEHTSEELKLILAGLRTRGVISFRRLLWIENLFDLGGLTVADKMRPRGKVSALSRNASKEELARTILNAPYSRFPVVDERDEVVGFLHVKDLLREQLRGRPLAIEPLIRPVASTSPDRPLEGFLVDLQRSRAQAAVVRDDAGRWIGWLTMEDALEELVGTIEDEFESEPPVTLADAISEERIVTDLQAASVPDAIEVMLKSVPATALPRPAEEIRRALLDREAAFSTYLGNGVAMPHARLPGLDAPVILFARSLGGLTVESSAERAHLLFFVLTPASRPRDQVRIVGRIARMLESETVKRILLEAPRAPEILEAIREGDRTR